MARKRWPPIIVVRARLQREALAEFQRWYREVHLPHVLAIPGVVRAYRADCHRRGVTWAALYELRDDDALQEALNSPQAQQARQDWQAWIPHLDELSLEVLAGLVPIPAYHHWN
ncbi:MAG: DUF4286 family protein [Dehalococcoidia bacterium]|jgi:hypothetical protein|nr:DUF4286 family protein [Dehalococcoidia bacterium]